MRARQLILSMLLAFPVLGHAQDEGLPVHGNVTVNQRFVDISGREQKYREFFNLQRGPSASLELFGKPKASRFVDSYGVDVYGVGSDRYSGGQMRVGKTGRWDLRVNYRESAFFWNRNDGATQPTGLQGLTTNHDWDTERRFGSLSFSTRATENIRLTFDYNRNTRTGAQFTTRVIDYFGAAGTFASFQRANPYEVGAVLSEPGNVNDVMNRFTGGISYAAKRWNVFYKAGFQQFREELKLENLRSPQRSINTGDASTANELITTARWNESRRLSAPLSEFSYTGHPYSRLKLRGAYVFYRYSGPASLDSEFTGFSRANSSGTIVAPYTITETDRATVKEPNHVIDQGLTFQAAQKLNVHADYRYSRFTIHSNGQFQGVNNGVTNTGASEHEWRSGLHQLDLALEFMLRRDITIRPGIRLSRRDLTVQADGIAHPRISKRSKVVAPIGSIAHGNPGSRRHSTPVPSLIPPILFKLKFHREQKEVAAFDLVVAKPGKMTPSKDQTPPSDAYSGPRGLALSSEGAPPPGIMLMDGRFWQGTSITVSSLAGGFRVRAGRPVVDKTGLTGFFDIKVPMALDPPTPGQGRGSLAGAGLSTMDAQMLDGLGLKLEFSKTIVEVLMIDHIEKPTEN